MKGAIICCMKEMVVDEFGLGAWMRLMDLAGVGHDTLILAQTDFSDEKFKDVIDQLARLLGISRDEAGEAFGEYWASVYAPKVYASFYFSSKNARAFLMKMDKVHEKATRSMMNTNPPRFFYEDGADGSLVMTYESERYLMSLFIGAIRGVGKHYHEELQIISEGPNKVRIIFPEYATKNPLRAFV